MREWLLRWWDSLESVTTFRWWMGFLAISFAGLSALSGGFRWFADNRRDYLKTQQERRLTDPWRLSAQQREQFVAILREGQSPIGKEMVEGDPYAQDFAAELTTLFIEAGWMHPDSHFALTRYIPPLYGIRFNLDLPIGGDESQARNALEKSTLKRAFDAAGIPLQISVNPTSAPSPFPTLQIGHRPPK
jgi:hypothetical protein